MRFVLFNGEKSINDLATRIFAIQGTNAQAATTQAAAALAKANPQLADLTKVSVGSLIAVPDNAPAIAPDQQAIASNLVRSLAVQTVQSASDTLQQRLTAIETAASTKLKSAMDNFPTTNFKTAIQNLSNPEIVKRLPSLDVISKTPADAATVVQSAQDLRKQSLNQLTSAIASFVKK